MRHILTLALTLSLSAAAAGAGTLAGVTLPDTAEVEGQSLVLDGMALREKYFFDVYVAGLYLPQKESDGAKVLATDAPRRTVMQFVRSVGKDKVCEGWDEGLAANTPGASAELKDQFKTLCSWMEDVKNGEAYTFTYVPGKGTQIDFKGTTKGTIEGKAFADALFACWIGPKPGPGEAFKHKLLGG